MSNTPDMLARLATLPDPSLYYERAQQHAAIRRITCDDEEPLRALIASKFEARWVDAIAEAFAREPAAAYVAVDAHRPVGFAFYDAAHLGTFGPMGVD